MLTTAPLVMAAAAQHGGGLPQPPWGAAHLSCGASTQLSLPPPHLCLTAGLLVAGRWCHSGRQQPVQGERLQLLGLLRRALRPQPLPARQPHPLCAPQPAAAGPAATLPVTARPSSCQAANQSVHPVPNLPDRRCAHVRPHDDGGRHGPRQQGHRRQRRRHVIPPKDPQLRPHLPPEPARHGVQTGPVPGRQRQQHGPHRRLRRGGGRRLGSLPAVQPEEQHCTAAGVVLPRLRAALRLARGLCRKRRRGARQFHGQQARHHARSWVNSRPFLSAG